MSVIINYYKQVVQYYNIMHSILYVIYLLNIMNIIFLNLLL